MATHEQYQQLLAYRIADIEQDFTARDTMLYALGVGLGADPVDEQQLRFVTEKALVVLPTMAVVICMPHGWVRHSGIGFGLKGVHGEQSFTLHRPIPPEGTFLGKTRLAGVIDKGEGRGALIETERQVFDRKSGELIATLGSTSFCRGDGGFGGPTGPIKAPHALPARAPDATCDLPTLPQAALIYRLSGDVNPLHSDPAHATRVGFPRPILHGLCTMGVAGHALLRTQCGYDPAKLRSMAVRFSAPVYPGETLRTEMWRDGAVVSFRVTVPARENVVVLNNGRAEIAG